MTMVHAPRRSPVSLSQLILLVVFLGVSAFSAAPLSSSVPDTVVCQTAEACFRNALHAGKNAESSSEAIVDRITKLQIVRSQFPGTMWAKRAGVHLGLLLKETSPADAIQHFRLALTEFPILDDYLNFWIAEALVIDHRPQEAAMLFEQVGSRKSQSRLRNEALFLAGRAWRASGDCSSAIRRLREAVKRQSASTHAARAWSEIGMCEWELKHLDAAHQAFREVWWRFPSHSEANKAKKFLSQPPFKDFPEPTREERYQRALSLYKVAAFEKAVTGLQPYIQTLPKGRKRDDAQFKLGMAFVRLKQYDKAEKVFHVLSKSQSHRKGEAFVWLARSYLRQGKGAQLLALQAKVKSYGLSGDRQALIHVFSGVWLGDQGKSDQAIRAFDRASRVARSSSRRQDALWRINSMYYQRADYPKVLETLKRLVRIAKGGDREAGVRYWMARTYDHLQKPVKAQAIYRDLTQSLPFTYYGQLAQSRVSKPISFDHLGAVQKVSTRKTGDSSSSLVKNVRYRKAIELLGLELFQEAQEELNALKRRSVSNVDVIGGLITIAQQAGAYDFGIRLAIRHFGQRFKKAQIPRSSELWSGAYPTGYVSMIQRYAPSGLDPYLVAGLIREESLYDARAMSRVGARGLMQLMPTTADRVARRLGIQSLEHEELFDAEVNIQLGTTYVGQLLSRFNGNVVHAVAAYNAGPEAVERWMAQYPDVPSDEFVERIAYRETRRYVKRVLGSYRIYRALASSPCQTASLDRMC